MIIKTTNTIKIDKNKDIHDLKKCVIEFLTVNGITTSVNDYVSINNSESLILNFDCANCTYTRAIGLLLIIISFDDNSYIYFSNNIKLELDNTELINSTIEHINKHKEITITDV